MESNKNIFNEDFDFILEDFPLDEDNFESIGEDFLDVSDATTLSALEGMELDIGEADFCNFEEAFNELKHQKELDEILLQELIEDKPAEFFDLYFNCEICKVDFTTSSNLLRHKKSKKHERLAKAIEMAKNSEFIQTGPFTYEVKVNQPQVVEQEQDFVVMDVEVEEFEQVFVEVIEATEPKSSNKSKSKLFRCQFCPKVFTTNSNWRRHENLHGNERIHECSVCKKAFMQKEYLRKHMIVHEDKAVKKQLSLARKQKAGKGKKTRK